HEWDGIRELNTPLPRWWLLLFYACILFSVGYWVLYPAWPIPGGFTKGILGYSSRGELTQEMAAARGAQQVYLDKIAATPLD
ncbi:cbb3-type cytochrome c oxidase N-terminal domain-containing protein, partial [Staphylococcus aureus]